MKLLNSFGPNPRMVRMFLAEKRIELAQEDLDLLGAENRGESYLAKNPGGQMPALELDDGSVIAETTTICEYLEELHRDLDDGDLLCNRIVPVHSFVQRCWRCCDVM